MAESQPLSESAKTKDGIAPQVNGTRIIESGRNTNRTAIKQSFSEEHIEAPCCRDIHGRNEPPDGGMRAWLVMVSAFVCNGVIFGTINTYGIIYALLTDRLTTQGEKEASSKA
ncbi:unnamed protein product, partial [Ceratitis capitata]